MAKRMPTVDGKEVENMIDFIFGRLVNKKLSAEERADLAHSIALNYSMATGMSAAYGKALAAKVRSKALWVTAPTGRDAHR